MARRDHYAEDGPVFSAAASGNIELMMNQLTEKQYKFCQEYIIDYNAAAATKRAGYTTKHANRWGKQLLENPCVKGTIRHLAEQRVKDTAVKPDYVIRKVINTIEKAEMDGKDAIVLKGCELLARHLGMFIERQEISGPNGDPIKYEQVREAADAFTSAIAGLIEREGPEPTPFLIESGDKS
jgi:phage terminase small subunit